MIDEMRIHWLFREYLKRASLMAEAEAVSGAADAYKREYGRELSVWEMSTLRDVGPIIEPFDHFERTGLSLGASA